jgi:hypothetical protein
VPLSFNRELVDKSIDDSDDGPVNHIASRVLDVVSGGFGKQLELEDGVLAPIRSERRPEISVTIRNGERQPIPFRVPHARDEEFYNGAGLPAGEERTCSKADWRSYGFGVTAERW